MKECPACRHCFPDELNNCPSHGDELTRSIPGDTVLDKRYQLDLRLGQGGMGIVFKGRHIFLKTLHAIKVILPDHVGNDHMLVTRFRQEAMVAARMRHHNIVNVTDFGVTNGSMPYLVMDFIKGNSLQEVLAERGRLSPEYALEIMAALCAGIGAAHKQEIIHRDLKPLNIMLQDDMPVNEGIKILDFGLAKIKSGEFLGSFVAAQTTGLMGSPFYMAPELWSDEDPDLRVDVYSLGVILFQLLTNDLPFKGATIPSIMNKHLNLAPPSLISLGVNVPPAVDTVVRHALAKDREDRLPSVEDFISELRHAVQSTPAQFALLPTETLGSQLVTMSFPETGSGEIDGGIPSKTGGISQGELTLPDSQERIEHEADRLRIEFEEAQRRADEARLRAEEAAWRRAEEETAWRKAEGEVARKRAEEEAARQRAEEEAARIRAEEKARKLAAEVEEVQRRAEEARPRAEEETRKRAKQEEARKLAEEEIARERAEAAARIQAEEEAKRITAAEETDRLAHEVAEAQRRAGEARQRAEEEARKRVEEEEAQRLTEEAARQRAEEERRLAAESEVKRKVEEYAVNQRQWITRKKRHSVEHTATTPLAETLVLSPEVTPKETQTDLLPSTSDGSFQRTFPTISLDTGPTAKAEDTWRQSQSSVDVSLAGFDDRKTGQRSVSPMVIGVVIGFVLTAFLGMMIYRYQVTKSAYRTTQTTHPTPSPNTQDQQRPRRHVMSKVEGGTFLMGRNDVALNSTDTYELSQYPAHPVPVKTFWMDKTEVTNEEYAEFVQAAKHPTPGYWNKGAVKGAPPPGKMQWPVIEVSLEDAKRFANWRTQRDKRNYRLPTETEWEYAARNGAQDTFYPWGNQWINGYANLDEKSLTPVGSFPQGASQAGVLDLIGNVGEWTSSQEAIYEGNDRLRKPGSGRFVIRGGAFTHPSSGPKAVTATRRWFLKSRDKNATVGFRLVSDEP